MARAAVGSIATSVSAGFSDASQEAGLDRAMAPLGANFGDVDNDGYLDIYLGAAETSYNALFQNTGLGPHWLKVKLVGTKSNRAALGARIKVELKSANGQSRSIHRTVGNNSSFGGDSLVESIGPRNETCVATPAIFLANV
jgi:hypothetical protein